MAVVHEQITSFADFTEFDTMFAAAESRLDLNFFSQVPNELSFDEKKAYYRSQIESVFAGTWQLQNAGETPFFYKGVYDGVTMEFSGGFIEADGITFRGHWYLTAPDGNGSRNAIHTADTATSRRAFYTTHGLTRYKVPTYVGSSLDQWMKLRISDGSITEISRTEAPMGDETHITYHLEV
jgi:hypothetical protein